MGLLLIFFYWNFFLINIQALVIYFGRSFVGFIIVISFTVFCISTKKGLRSCFTEKTDVCSECSIPMPCELLNILKVASYAHMPVLT